MKRLAFYLSLALVVLALASCKGEGKSLITPASSGRPYEILVVADDNCWMSPDSALFMCWTRMFQDCLSRNALSVSQECELRIMTGQCVCSVI